MSKRFLDWFTVAGSLAFVAVFGVAVLGATALAGAPPASAPATQPVTADNAQGITGVLSSALHCSNWRLVVIAGLLLAVFLLRKVGGFFWPWVQTDRGGASLALLAAVLTVLVNGLVAGKGLDPQLILDGVLTGLTAIGTFTAAKKIAAPADKQ